MPTTNIHKQPEYSKAGTHRSTAYPYNAESQRL